jgi:hypothetical protein
MLTRSLFQSANATMSSVKNNGVFQSKRQIGTTINLVDRVIATQRENRTIANEPFLELLKIRDSMAKYYEAVIDINQNLTGKNSDGIVTAAQIKQSFTNLILLVEKYPDLEAPLAKKFDPTLYRSDGVWVGGTFDVSHSEDYKKNNCVKQILKASEEALFETMPSKDEKGKLTEFGERIKNEMGEFAFLKATQLLTNHLAEQTGTRSTTDAHIGKPPGRYAATWKDPHKAFMIEKEVQKSNLDESDQIYCKENQKDLLEILKRENKLTQFTEEQYMQAVRYVELQDEVLLDPSKLTPSVEIFRQTQTECAHIFRQMQDDLQKEIKCSQVSAKME